MKVFEGSTIKTYKCRHAMLTDCDITVSLHSKSNMDWVPIKLGVHTHNTLTCSLHLYNPFILRLAIQHSDWPVSRYLVYLESHLQASNTVELLYSGHHWGMKFGLYRGVALSQELICTKKVHLGLSEVALGGLMSGVAFMRGSTIDSLPLST